MQRTSLRWLLRTFGEDPFLRYYLEPGSRRRELEYLFWALPVDDEHRKNTRKAAWKILEEVAAELDEPQRVFQKIYACVGDHLRHPNSEDERDLPGFYGLDFLFPRKRPDPTVGLVETHAHFRGSVPLEGQWRRLMKDVRLRAEHRKTPVEVGTWCRTRAELLMRAAELTRQVSTEPCAVEAYVRKLEGSEPLSAEEVALLAIRANFGHFYICRRGEIGLSEFTERYQRFTRACKRKGFAASRDDRDQVREALAEFATHGVDAVELRPTAETTRIELQRKLRSLVLGYFCRLQSALAAKRECPRFGLVVSLFKQQLSGKLEERVPGRIEGSTSGAWVQMQAELWKRQMRGLLAVLDEVPALRFFVVGVDAAGREQGCPARDFGPAFALVHAYHRRHGVAKDTPGRRMKPAMKALQNFGLKAEEDPERQAINAKRAWDDLCERDDLAPIRLGLTVHVGEDFCDPITGLREIWDAIEHLGLRCGDRLGHALAAGLSPDRLDKLLKRRAAGSHRFVQALPGGRDECVTKPSGVHLLDEAWQLQRLPELRPGDLIQAVHSALGASMEARVLSKSLSCAAEIPVPGLHFHALEKIPPDLQVQVQVDEAYRARFEALRTQVVERIRERGLFIESCPTSNIVVAGLDEPPLHTFLKEIPECVTIASDDPAIFGAWPDDELRKYAQGKEGDLIKNSERATFL